MKDEAIVQVWRAVVAGVTVVVITLVTSCQVTNQRIVEAVEAGAHPVVAACALDASTVCSSLTLLELEKVNNE